MRIGRRRAIAALGGLGASALLVLLFRPAPVAVDAAPVVRGPLVVTVDEEGQTRVLLRAVVAAPAAGRLARIALDEGDPVAQDALLASLAPVPLDPRPREQDAAHVRQAEAALREAKAQEAAAFAALDLTRKSLARARLLAAGGSLPVAERERAETAERSAADEAAAARFRSQGAAAELSSARAALVETPSAGHVVEVRAPAAGRVLRLFEKSERVVQAGTPLLEIGDPSSIEVVVDLLSSDAVRVRSGAPMQLDDGSGLPPLAERVHRIEPSGFTKVSPLGVEEQRVNVIGRFTAPPLRLGDRYRVEASIEIWRGRDVLKTPVDVQPVVAGNAAATDIQTGAAVTLNLTDPDSMTVDLRGNIVLDSQADTELVFIRNPATSHQQVGLLPITVAGKPTTVDDTAFVPVAGSYLLFTDVAKGIIYRLDNPTWGFEPGTGYSSSDTAGIVGVLNLDSGALTPIATGFGSTRGMLFVTFFDPDNDGPP